MNSGESSNAGWNSGFNSSSDGNGNYSSSSSFGRNAGVGENTGRNRGLNRGESRSDGFSETMDAEIEPGDFARALKTGGPANRNNVTAVWFQAGKTFDDSRRNYLLTRFEQ
jgi:hypothetical protein